MDRVVFHGVRFGFDFRVSGSRRVPDVFPGRKTPDTDNLSQGVGHLRGVPLGKSKKSHQSPQHRLTDTEFFVGRLGLDHPGGVLLSEVIRLGQNRINPGFGLQEPFLNQDPDPGLHPLREPGIFSRPETLFQC